MNAYEEAPKGVICVLLQFLMPILQAVKLNEQQLKCLGITTSIFLLLLEVYYQYFSDPKLGQISYI